MQVLTPTFPILNIPFNCISMWLNTINLLKNIVRKSQKSIINRRGVCMNSTKHVRCSATPSRRRITRPSTKRADGDAQKCARVSPEQRSRSRYPRAKESRLHDLALSIRVIDFYKYDEEVKELRNAYEMKMKFYI